MLEEALTLKGMDVAKLKNLLLQTTKMNQKNIYYKDDNFTLLKGDSFNLLKADTNLLYVSNLVNVSISNFSDISL